jgi:hypothetical protein
MQHLPASWRVTGPKGAYVAFMGQHVKRVGAHKCDLAAPSWARFSTSSLPFTGMGLYPATTRDDLRQCFYVVQAYQRGTPVRYRIDKNGEVTELRDGGIGVSGLVSCMGYAPPPYDVVVSLGSDMAVRHPDAWGTYRPPMTGTRPSFADPNGLHPEWDPDRNCFVLWDPLELKVHKLHPPSGDPLTREWAWEEEKIMPSVMHPPVARPRRAPGGQWSKLRRIPALKAFVYPASMTELQIIRPKGA